jgi:hypothetical protein
MASTLNPRKRTRAWRRAANASVRTSRSTQPTPRCAPNTAPRSRTSKRPFWPATRPRPPNFRQDAVRGRHRRRQGHLPQEQGRSRQEPPVCQGQSPGHRCNFRQTARVPITGTAVCNGCAVSKSKKPPSGRLFCFGWRQIPSSVAYRRDLAACDVASASGGAAWNTCSSLSFAKFMQKSHAMTS